jgi:ADP-heptose:LPS heptosyltransferase
MIDQLVHNAHHAFKKVPFLRAFDRWAVDFWFNSSFIRFIFEMNLLLRLTVLALRRRKRLIVLCRFGGIGDMICAIPAVREFIRTHKDDQVVYVTRLAYGDLISRANLGIPCVKSAMHVLPPPWATWVIKKCIYLSYVEEEVNLKHSPRGLIEEFGKGFGFDHLTEDPVLEVNKAETENIRQNYLRNGKQKIVLLHSGPTWNVREWPIESWTQLVAILKEDPSIEILQIVAARNATVLQATCPVIPGAIAIECADNMMRLIDIIAAADLLIGIDSGPIHIAGAVGTNCVAVFGPTDPALRLWKTGHAEGIFHEVPCSFCHHRRPRLHWQTGCPHDIICMRGIKVDQVLDKVAHFLPLQPLTPNGR